MMKNKSYILILLIFLCLHFNLSYAKPTTIVMWHSLAGPLGKQLNKLVKNFNDHQHDYFVKLIYKGEYTESLTNFVAAFRANKQPAIIQVAEVGSAIMLKTPGIIKPLEDLVEEQQVDLQIKDFLPGLRFAYSKSNRLQAMPLNVSIPVIYYNIEALKKVGTKELPKTWHEMENLAAKFKQAGFNCVYTSAYQSWVQIEAFAVIHGLSLIDLSGSKAFYNHKEIIRHLERLYDWMQKNYFAYGGRTNDATTLFTSGRCPIFSQSSGSYKSLAKLINFPIAFAPLPLDTNVTNKRHGEIIGGAALWAVAGHSPQVERGTAVFFAYLAQPKVQLQWSKDTGYLPLGIDGIYAFIAKENSDEPAIKYAKLIKLKNGINYLNAPLNQIRIINDEALEKIFAGIKTPKEAILEAVKKADYALLRFKR